MFSVFRSNPIRKLQKQYELKIEKAMLAQRNGDIEAYSQLTFDAQAIYKDIQRIEAEMEKS